MNIIMSFLAATLAVFAFTSSAVVKRTTKQQQDTILKVTNPKLDTRNLAPGNWNSFGVFIKDSLGNPVALTISKLDVQVQITGTIATTTLDMTVYNPHRKVLEGEFSFPVADGQTVSRFALDINGKLREAVVVDKSKGRQTFEEVIRTKVDPALLEWTRDNSFKTRIYPLPAQGTRRVLIAYEQQLTSLDVGFGYTIPFAFPEKINEFMFHASVAGFGLQPSLTGGMAQTVAFTPKGRTFEVEMEETDILVNRPFTINVPVVLNQHQVIVQDQGNEQFAGIFLAMQPAQNKRPLPRSLVVFWDASISGLKRDVEKEMRFLEAFIAKARPANIELVAFANSVLNRENIPGADAQLLLRRLREIPMDGGTQLGIVPFAEVHADLAILCSDGISTFGKHQPVLGTVPVITLASGAQADHAILRTIAGTTGGEFINLFSKDPQGAVADALMDKLAVRRVDVVDGRVDDLRPSGVIPVEDVTTITGKLRTSSATLRITTSLAGGQEQVETVTINSTEHRLEGTSVPRLWATQELQRLSNDRVRNAESITALGQRFNIVTPGTSLIVLERMEDYVRFDIEPPVTEPELRQQFAAQRRDSEKEKLEQTKAHKAAVLAMFKQGGQVSSAIAPVKDANFWMWPVTSTLPTNARANDLGIMLGTVSDATGRPLAGSTVNLFGDYAEVTTDQSGQFRFSNLPPGEYIVAVNADGYRPTTRTLNVQPQGTENVSFKLTSLPPRDQNRKRGKDLKTRKESAGALSGNTAPTEPAVGASAMGAGTAALRSVDAQSPISVGDAMMAESEVQQVATASFSSRGAIEFSESLSAAPEASAPIAQTAVDDLAPSDAYDVDARRSNIVVTREAWTDALAKAPSQKLYETYLELRPTFIDATGYYLDVADALIAVGQPERALRVLSSLAELQGEDSRTLRILAHRLMQLKRADLAVMVFEDVKRVRDEEPQSYRDLGLALAACGRYNDAVDQFLYVIEHPWHNRFPEIEMIAAREMARIAEDKGVNKQRIDTNYLIPFRNDVRVVLTWDADNCDMDLWVTDPNGETCKYNNRNTVLGGRMSRDLTGGYGPEEFTLPNAKKGAYKIQVHYYGDRQQNLARPTTVQVEMYARYGTKSEAHDAVTMRLDGVSRVIDIGTILVN